MWSDRRGTLLKVLNDVVPGIGVECVCLSGATTTWQHAVADLLSRLPFQVDARIECVSDGFTDGEWALLSTEEGACDAEVAVRVGLSLPVPHFLTLIRSTSPAAAASTTLRCHHAVRMP